MPNDALAVSDVFGKDFVIGGIKYTVGAIGTKDGERYVMAADEDGGVLLYPWDSFVNAVSA